MVGYPLTSRLLPTSPSTTHSMVCCSCAVEFPVLCSLCRKISERARGTRPVPSLGRDRCRSETFPPRFLPSIVHSDVQLVRRRLYRSLSPSLLESEGPVGVSSTFRKRR